MEGQVAVAQIRRDQQLRRDRKDALLKRIHAKAAPEAEVPREEMACPACDERYLFGSECPDCEVDLVAESLLGSPSDDISVELAAVRSVEPNFWLGLGAFIALELLLSMLQAWVF